MSRYRSRRHAGRSELRDGQEVIMDSWYRVTTPRKEVPEGRSFNLDEFAIALERVVAGTAPEDYRDPEPFFARTCFTRALRSHRVETAEGREDREHRAGPHADHLVRRQDAHAKGGERPSGLPRCPSHATCQVQSAVAVALCISREGPYGFRRSRHLLPTLLCVAPF